MRSGTAAMEQGAKAGVEAGFDAFYACEYKGVAALAYVLCGNPSTAEDLAQDAFVLAHRRWAEIAAYDKPGAWVRKVVTNMASSFLRRKRTEARAMLRLRSRSQPQMAFLAA